MKNIRLLILSLLAVFCLSCKVVEPDAFYNAKADIEPKGIVRVVDYDSSQVITQMRKITFVLDSSNIIGKYAEIYEKGFVTSITDNQFVISFYPEHYSNGKHSVFITIIPKDMGLYSVTRFPVLSYNFYFKTKYGSSPEVAIGGPIK